MRKKQLSRAHVRRPTARNGPQHRLDRRSALEPPLVTTYSHPRLGQLQALYQLTSALSRTTALEDIYDAALAGLLQALEVDRASILLFDPDGVMRFKAWRGLSERYRRATEGHTPWSPDTINPQPVLVPNVDTEPTLASLHAVIRGEGIQALAFVPLVHQGRLLGKFMLYYPTPHQFSDDEVQLAQNIADHIAVAVARRHGEEALRSSQERLTLAYQAANLGTFEWNIQTNAVVWSAEEEALYGLPEGRFGGTYEDWKQVVHPADRDRAANEVMQAARSGRDLDTEFRIVWPDSSVRWIAAKGRIYCDRDGTPLRMIGINEDITLRKQAEQRRGLQYAVSRVLAEATTLAEAAPLLLQAIGESLSWQFGTLWVVDQRANALVCVATWHTPAQVFPTFKAGTQQRTFLAGVGLPGRIWIQAQPVWIADVVIDANFPRAPLARSEGLHAAFGFPLQLERQVLGVIEFFSDAIQAPDPDLLELVAALGTQIGQFIERKQAEAERVQLLERERAARAEAQEAVRMREVFLSVASHELKTPLTSLLGQAQLLQRRAQRDASMHQRELHSIDVIATQSSRLHKMILALLDLSRLESGQLHIERAPLDLQALVQRVVAEVQPMLDQHTLIYRSAIGPLIIEGDELRLEQVLYNLIQNAIKYSPHGGEVTVEVMQRGTLACVAVTDTGMGIPADALPQLFGRFYRAPNAEAQHIVGMGIGLYVVKEIVALHGGSVVVESVEGSGSTFTVCLPALQGSATTPATSEGYIGDDQSRPET